MATPYVADKSILIPEARHVNNETFHRNRAVIITLKSIELFLTILILTMINDDGKMISDRSTQFIFAVLGAFIVVPLFVMGGFIVREETPKLLVALNFLGAILFSAVAGLLLHVWEDQLLGEGYSSSIFLSIVATTSVAILYIVDAFLAYMVLPSSTVLFYHTLN